ncbi:MAG: hypothetical protein JRH20_26990, partial [Deltaproteobacteria bacterium]|nr:hypothetical protein [Deltaproteobacteria bacterium]
GVADLALRSGQRLLLLLDDLDLAPDPQRCLWQILELRRKLEGPAASQVALVIASTPETWREAGPAAHAAESQVVFQHIDLLQPGEVALLAEELSLRHPSVCVSPTRDEGGPLQFPWAWGALEELAPLRGREANAGEEPTPLNALDVAEAYRQRWTRGSPEREALVWLADEVLRRGEIRALLEDCPTGLQLAVDGLLRGGVLDRHGSGAVRLRFDWFLEYLLARRLSKYGAQVDESGARRSKPNKPGKPAPLDAHALLQHAFHRSSTRRAAQVFLRSATLAVGLRQDETLLHHLLKSSHREAPCLVAEIIAHAAQIGPRWQARVNALVSEALTRARPRIRQVLVERAAAIGLDDVLARALLSSEPEEQTAAMTGLRDWLEKSVCSQNAAGAVLEKAFGHASTLGGAIAIEGLLEASLAWTACHLEASPDEELSAALNLITEHWRSLLLSPSFRPRGLSGNLLLRQLTRRVTRRLDRLGEGTPWSTAWTTTCRLPEEKELLLRDLARAIEEPTSVATLRRHTREAFHLPSAPGLMLLQAAWVANGPAHPKEAAEALNALCAQALREPRHHACAQSCVLSLCLLARHQHLSDADREEIVASHDRALERYLATTHGHVVFEGDQPLRVLHLARATLLADQVAPDRLVERTHPALRMMIERALARGDCELLVDLISEISRLGFQHHRWDLCWPPLTLLDRRLDRDHTSRLDRARAMLAALGDELTRRRVGGFVQGSWTGPLRGTVVLGSDETATLPPLGSPLLVEGSALLYGLILRSAPARVLCREIFEALLKSRSRRDWIKRVFVLCGGWLAE